MKLNHDEPLSNFAFNLNLRRYIMEHKQQMNASRAGARGPGAGPLLHFSPQPEPSLQLKPPDVSLKSAYVEVTSGRSVRPWCGVVGMGVAIAGGGDVEAEVGRCTFIVSKPVVKAPQVSALETRISQTAFNVRFQLQLAALQRGPVPTRDRVNHGAQAGLCSRLYTFRFRIGAKRAKAPANQISLVNHSLDQSLEGLQGLQSAGDWV